MKLASWPLQVAVYERLVGTLSIPVYEGEAPQDENGDLVAVPYVVIGEGTSSGDWSDKRSPGTQETLTIHVWTDGDQGGYRDVKQYMSEVTKALMRERLEISGFFVSHTMLELAETLAEEDHIRHGVLRFRFWIHQRGGI